MTEPVDPAMSADLERAQGLDAPPYPAAFHYGPGHMIVHGNPPFVAMFGQGALGQPAREVMLDLPAKAFELMDLVLSSGKPGACQITDDGGSPSLRGRAAQGPRDRRDVRGHHASPPVPRLAYWGLTRSPATKPESQGPSESIETGRSRGLCVSGPRRGRLRP